MLRRVSLARGLAASLGGLVLFASVEAAAATRSEQFDCVRKVTPPALRTGLVAAAPDVEAMTAQLKGSQIDQIADACAIARTEADGLILFMALIAPALEAAESGDLKGKFGLDDAAVEQAWKQFPAASREDLGAMMEREEELTDATADELEATTTRLKLPDTDEARRAVFGLIAGRAIIERFRK